MWVGFAGVRDEGCGGLCVLQRELEGFGSAGGAEFGEVVAGFADGPGHLGAFQEIKFVEGFGGLEEFGIVGGFEKGFEVFFLGVLCELVLQLGIDGVGVHVSWGEFEGASRSRGLR